MQNKSQTFIWSDGWWLEGNKAWFIDGMTNTLFCVDMNIGKCEKVVCIPDEGEGTYRLNSYCAKCGRDIYCIPGSGQSIWIYNLDDEIFTEVNLKNLPERYPPGGMYWVLDDKIFIVVDNWNRIIEVNTDRGLISDYYIICENDSVYCSVLADDSIFALSSKLGRIYQFDILTKKVTAHLLPGIKKRLARIGFDGERFWLSGYEKEVYVWDRENDNLTTINFSGIYKVDCTDQETERTVDNYGSSVFNRIIAVGEYIWFIPIQERKIMYANKQTTKLSVLKIYEEDQMNAAVSRVQYIGNYILEYVRDDRYIGLFSAKSRRVLEIDTKELIYQWKEYYFSEQYLQQYCKKCKGIYYEGRDPLCVPAYHMESQEEVFEESSIDNIGMAIHTRMVQEDVQ